MPHCRLRGLQRPAEAGSCQSQAPATFNFTPTRKAYLPFSGPATFSSLRIPRPLYPKIHSQGSVNPLRTPPPPPTRNKCFWRRFLLVETTKREGKGKCPRDVHALTPKSNHLLNGSCNHFISFWHVLKIPCKLHN